MLLSTDRYGLLSLIINPNSVSEVRVLTEVAVTSNLDFAKDSSL